MLPDSDDSDDWDSDDEDDEDEDELTESISRCEMSLSTTDSMVKMYLMRRDKKPPNPKFVTDMAKCVRDRLAALEECQDTLCGFLNKAMVRATEPPNRTLPRQLASVATELCVS